MRERGRQIRPGLNVPLSFVPQNESVLSNLPGRLLLVDWRQSLSSWEVGTYNPTVLSRKESQAQLGFPLSMCVLEGKGTIQYLFILN